MTDNNTINGEKFYCVNCQQFNELNTHGRCMTCDSSQIISEHALKQAQSRIEALGSRTENLTERIDRLLGAKQCPRLTLYCARIGIFYTTLYASSPQDAKARAVSPEITWQIDFDTPALGDGASAIASCTCEEVNAQKTLDNDTTLR